ncbi:uncharacterized protein LOC144873678 [Branchiostoma floridae x Branchiostoma japonicum]
MSGKEAGECDQQISCLRQYHPHLLKHMVKEVMKYRQQGAYLIRKSESQSGAYTVSVMHTNRHVYHFKILQQDRMYGVIPDKVRFPSVAAMLDYYSDHDVPGMDAGKSVRHIRLRDPIYRHPELAARSQSVEETRKTPGKSLLQRYMSVPSEGGAEGRELIKSSPWQLQQEQQIQPQEPLPDDMLEDHYEVPRKVNLSQLPTLMSPEEDTEGACSCGIPHQVSHLTHGWEVHRVHHQEDASNFGKLFFHNKRTEETLWTLPPSVSSQLTEESRRALEQLESEG